MDGNGSLTTGLGGEIIDLRERDSSQASLIFAISFIIQILIPRMDFIPRSEILDQEGSSQWPSKDQVGEEGNS